MCFVLSAANSVDARSHPSALQFAIFSLIVLDENGFMQSTGRSSLNGFAIHCMHTAVIQLWRSHMDMPRRGCWWGDQYATVVNNN